MPSHIPGHATPARRASLAEVSKGTMRLLNLFATETDSDGKGHFNADDVCSVALLKHGTTRSYVDMQMAEGKHLRGWVDSKDLDEILD